MILGISLLVSLLVGFTPIGYPLSLHRAIAFFPFFLMGYVARELNLMEWLRSRNKILCALLLLGAFVACYFLGGKVNRALFYFSAPYDQPIEALYRLVLLCGAISCGVAVLSICPAGDKLSSAGSNTMPIYIYHAYFISIFRSAGKLGLPQTLPSMLACTAVLLLFLVQVSKIRFFNEMLRPITMVRNWLRK